VPGPRLGAHGQQQGFALPAAARERGCPAQSRRGRSGVGSGLTTISPLPSFEFLSP
jgi:hypothetical protein